MAPELHGREGVTFLVREVASKLREASGRACRERGGVRWLGTDGAAENRGGVRWLTGGRQQWGHGQNARGRSLL
jgi:hypothetical protein